MPMPKTPEREDLENKIKIVAVYKDVYPIKGSGFFSLVHYGNKNSPWGGVVLYAGSNRDVNHQSILEFADDEGMIDLDNDEQEALGGVLVETRTLRIMRDSYAFGPIDKEILEFSLQLIEQLLEKH